MLLRALYSGQPPARCVLATSVRWLHQTTALQSVQLSRPLLLSHCTQENKARTLLHSPPLRPLRTTLQTLQQFHSSVRHHQTGQQHRHGNRESPWSSANRSTVTYMIAVAVAVVGLSYAAVPLYRIFCQASGYGGTVGVASASDRVEGMEAVRERQLTIRFNADTSADMLWQFRPHQTEIKLVPGETALAFYTARNPTDQAVTGIATYNVIPFEAGLYFNKIQCFCFEEQRLNANEEVDMPVFFYIDPEFNDDPAMAKVHTITLSYTFFEAKEGEELQQQLAHLPHT